MSGITPVERADASIRADALVVIRTGLAHEQLNDGHR
jgi:hypothetical protein